MKLLPEPLLPEVISHDRLDGFVSFQAQRFCPVETHNSWPLPDYVHNFRVGFEADSPKIIEAAITHSFSHFCGSW